MKQPSRRLPEPAARRPFALDAGLVFGVALAVRLLHLWFVTRSPFASTLIGDARAYDTWARGIADGDWVGSGVFYQTPLYPYFLGILHALGAGLTVVRIAQAFLGAASCALLGLAASRIFDRRAGLVAGLLLAVYAPAVFFDALIQKPVLDVLLLCAALALLAGAVDTPGSTRRWYGVGLALGALALTRENALLFLGVVPAWLWVHHRAAGRQRLTLVAVMLTGSATVLVPVGLRNWYVGGEFLLTTAQSGPNFYIGNGPDADGRYVALRRGRGMVEYERADATELAQQAEGRTLSPAEVSRYWTVRTLREVASNPTRWLRLEARKFRLVWSATETMDTESQDAYAEWSPILRTLSWVAHFGILSPLAVVGAWLTWADRRRVWLLHLLVGTYMASLLAFYVLARYRVPMVPLFILFAAGGIVRLGDLGRMRVPSAAACAMVAAAAAIFANWPIDRAREAMRAQTYINLADRLLTDGRPDAAVSAYERAVAAVPDNPSLRASLGTLQIRQGPIESAIAHLTAAVQLDPSLTEAEFNLALALNNARRYQEAVDRYRSVMRRTPRPAHTESNLSVSQVNLGAQFEREGNLTRAIELFRDAAALAPDSFLPHYRLGRALFSTGAIEEATPHLAAAVRLNPADASAHFGLASAYRSRELFSEALVEYREALRISPSFIEAHNELGVTLGMLGRMGEAEEAFRAALRLDPAHAAASRNLTILESRKVSVRQGR